MWAPCDLNAGEQKYSQLLPATETELSAGRVGVLWLKCGLPLPIYLFPCLQIRIVDPEKWKLAKAKCQKENGWAFTEYEERDKDFICPEKYNHEFNTLKFRFQAKSPMEKEVDGEWEPYYHIGCCWVNKPLTECDSSAEQCDRRKT